MFLSFLILIFRTQTVTHGGGRVATANNQFSSSSTAPEQHIERAKGQEPECRPQRARE